MRFDCGMAAIRLQHEDPYYYGYSYLFSCDKRDKEFYSRPLSFMNGGD